MVSSCITSIFQGNMINLVSPVFFLGMLDAYLKKKITNPPRKSHPLRPGWCNRMWSKRINIWECRFMRADKRLGFYLKSG